MMLFEEFIAKISGLVEAYFPQTSDHIATLIEQGHNDHMSPIGMYLAADIVVKSVMILLATASILVWGVFVYRSIALQIANTNLKRQYRRFEKLGSLTKVTPTFGGRWSPTGALVRTTLMEIEKSDLDLQDGIKERVSIASSRIELGAVKNMSFGTSFLAISGSTAPFIGLFGTVWGIMNSFISIAETNTTNLAVVAPGIAEALLATAIGLVAAIPAVIFYNLLTKRLKVYRSNIGDFSALVYRTLSRDLDLKTYVVANESSALSAVKTKAALASKDTTETAPTKNDFLEFSSAKVTES